MLQFAHMKHLFLLTAVVVAGIFIHTAVATRVGGAALPSTDQVGISSANVVLADSFAQSDGSVSFYHPAGLATDGERFFAVDRNNHRVLIWNKEPNKTTPPDVIIGQPNAEAHDFGSSLSQLYLPTSVAVGGGKLLVADTENNRVLVWNTIPTTNGQPADFSLDASWPWGVWTDGDRLAVSSTHDSKVLIWSSFPKDSSTPPDLKLTADGAMGTPRNITSNGQYLLVADHNARVGEQTEEKYQNTKAMTFVWKEWPKTDVAADFSLEGWRSGGFSADNKLLLVSTTHYPPSLWYAPPSDALDHPDVLLSTVGEGAQGFNFVTGDGSGAVFAGNHLYISLANGNKIVGYRDLPASSGQIPDLVLGAQSVEEDAFLTRGLITNPVVATNGRVLVATSDFDRRIYVWKNIPAKTGQMFDYSLEVSETPWDNDIFGTTVLLAGNKTLSLWNLGDVSLTNVMAMTQGVGEMRFQKLSGAALDARYTYVADEEGDMIYVWKGRPQNAADAPDISIPIHGPGRLHSNGIYLVAVTDHQRTVSVWNTDKLSEKPRVIKSGHARFNMPGDAMMVGDSLYIADTNNNKIISWHTLERAATDDLPADTVLGQGALLWPATLTFDGEHLWTGEFKFSGRIIQF